ncbi:uncharacterized protein LODBEIA_P34290 [Lodderomyces beijingensis]|uniref:RRM domain-containing protein n=1 Tax=Lodderomyces beijingensis TaxID=1775926 RepID=A0ABP0ZM22_9ASCO
MSSIEPKQTIYLNNLKDKVSLNKLKPALINLLNSHHLTPKSVKVASTLRLRGQAFITFNDTTESTQAIQCLQNRILFNKPICAAFAKTENDAVMAASLDQHELAQRKRIRHERRVSKNLHLRNLKRAKGAIDAKKSAKKREVDISEWRNLPPNRILLLQNISSGGDATGGIEAIFETFPGLEHVRFVQARNLALINFENEEMAKRCFENVDVESLKVKFGDDIIFSYAKK